MKLFGERPVNAGDAAFRLIALVFGLMVVGLLLVIILQLTSGAWIAITTFGLGFLVESTWDPVAREFGALPLIYGTVVSSLLALLFAVPVSVGAAVYLSEYAPDWLRTPVSFLVELLAAIPSIVYGLWGVFVMVPIVRSYIEVWLQERLGFLPLFQGPPYGLGMLAAGLILAIMILPIITAVSRDVMRAVPDTQREAMLALGATKWEVISRAVIPYARSGIVGATILGLGRALGETMAVTMVIGNRSEITGSLFGLAQTMASAIANEFTEATYDLYTSSLIELALVLLGVTVLLNAIARLLVWRVGGGPVGGRRE
ncbi:MAG: phosphate ABC transporter permease subunit PstC [Chloroflexi bacterium]|nr:phosphate ABC transporter permease subunit PstC [Chloroflexota bacterium]